MTFSSIKLKCMLQKPPILMVYKSQNLILDVNFYWIRMLCSIPDNQGKQKKLKSYFFL